MAALKLTCLDCGQINRVPSDRLAAGAKCGTCGAQLVPAKPVAVSFDQLEKTIRSDQLPLIVDIWAPWCGPCRMMGPEFEKAARELRGKARLVKVNSDQEPAASVRFNIRGIPSLLRFEGGREVKRHAGVMRAHEIVAWAG